MQPMLKTIDIFLGVAIVMLLVSMIVTVITQAVTSLANSRGRFLKNGLADMLRQLHPGIDEKIADRIARTALKQPLVSRAHGQLGEVIHREELTKILLELGAGDAPKQLEATAQTALHTALVHNGICRPGTPDEIQAQVRAKLKNIRALALQLELARPDLTNAARARVAMLQHAESEFLAKINLWFDQTMDRVSERFTTHARYVTFFAGLAVALFLQLDTAALVSRLSTDAELRSSLLQIAQREQPVPAPAQQNAAPPAGQEAAQPPVTLTDSDKQNLKDLMVNNVIGIPQSWDDWKQRWITPKDPIMKALGILLTAALLSLGAPFWYGALQSLLRLRSVLAGKDDEQRGERQNPSQAATQAAGTATGAAGSPDGVAAHDERGDLTAVA